MIIVLKDNPDQKQLENLVSWLKSMGLDIHMSKGQSATIMGLIGDTAAVDIDLINALDIVETVKRVQEPYKLSLIHIYPRVGAGSFQHVEDRFSIGEFHLAGGQDHAVCRHVFILAFLQITHVFQDGITADLDGAGLDFRRAAAFSGFAAGHR